MSGVLTTSGNYSNASLSYTTSSGGAYFTTRCRRLSHGYDVIANESHARNFRAFYPRQRALTQFTLTLELNGYRDYKAFMDFMRSYIINLEIANVTAMSVTVATRNFARFGVPIKGISDGDHVGSMVFSPVIVFEAIYDPLDPQLFTTASDTSQVDLNGSQADEAAKFFYPVTASTNDPNATGESLYDTAPPPTVPPVFVPKDGQRGGPS